LFESFYFTLFFIYTLKVLRGPWGSAESFPEGQRGHFAYLFQVADDEMQMDIHKTLFILYTTKKMPHVTARVTKLRFFGSISEHITIIYTIGYL